MVNANNLNNISLFLFELDFLRFIKRSILLTTTGPSVAEHCFRATIIGYFLASLANADNSKVVLMLLFHDIEETRIGDLNSIQKKYIKAANQKAIEDAMFNLPSSKEILSLIREFHLQNTLEAKLAKDADLLEQLMEEKEAFDEGNPEAKTWIRHSSAQLKTSIGKKLAEKIINSYKNDWWHRILA